MTKHQLLRLARGGALSIVLFSGACFKSKKPVTVGSKSTTAQAVMAEIVAQHLEHQLGRKVERKISLGNTEVVYQALTGGEIGIYMDETQTIQASVLKEPPTSDPSASLERVRLEMKRLAQVEVFDPLGIDNKWAIVVPKDKGVATLSEAAAQAKPGWRLGSTRTFSERSDGLTLLNPYKLPMGAPPRTADPGTLYSDLEKGDLTMVAGNVTDGALERHSDWVVLTDDKKVFSPYQSCLFARMDLLESDPKIRASLAALSGKFSVEKLRKLNVSVEFDHKTISDVAAEFLAQAGLK